MKRNSGNGRSFSLQLTASFMACMGALLAFISISLMTPLSSLLEKNAFERTKETVLQSVSTANVFIDRLLSTLYFATTVLPDSMDSGAAGWVEQMQMIKKSDSDIISIALFHRDGTLLGAVGAGDVSLDTDEVASSEWFQKALAWGGTSTYFSSPFVQHIFSGQRTFVIRLVRSAFYQNEGRLEQGVVLMDVSYASFSRLIEGVALGKSGYVYLLDRGGEIIAHPKLQLIYNGLHEENLDEINRLLIGQGRDKVDGRERVLIAATLNQTRWRLVGVAYLDELLVLQTAFVHILTVVLICALLLGGALWTMGVLRLPEAPMELLPGALFALLLLLYRIGDKSAAQFMWNDASSLGFMLTAAAWLSVLRALVEGKWNFRFDARRAAGWFALIVLALMQPYLDAQIASVIPAGDGYGRVLILLLTVLCGGCLIPFLRKDRSAGIMTAAAGAVMLLLYFLLTRTELAQSAGTMGSLLMLLAGGRNLSLYWGLLLSGAWCALGKEK